MYVSGIYHNILNPKKFIRNAELIGFELVSELSDGYDISFINHRIRRYERNIRRLVENYGSRFFPLLGSNYYACMKKP